MDANSPTCPNCGCEIVEGAMIYVCDICDKECCTPCSYNTEDNGVICEECHEKTGKGIEGI